MAEKKKALRIVFMGTPGFAAVVLKTLLAWPGGRVAAVFTQPDRPSGRGRKLKSPEVKTLALDKGLKVFQPENFKDPESVRLLSDLKPDILVTAAYGLILPRAVLDVPRIYALNVHASLLPKYRGAAPIARAILAGELVTGVTIMRMDAGMDTGPLLLQRAMAIGADETAEDLHDGLAELGGELLVEALERMGQGRLTAIPQDPAKASYAPRLTKAEGEINWDRPAQEVHNHIRAVHPWPGAYFHWQGRGREKPLRISVHPGRVGEELDGDKAPGTILGLADKYLSIACADRAYFVSRLTPEGKKTMSPEAFCNGYLNK
ncbi:MAG: methionyl-tRNA formyltransferase [Thermodesulfobacteriota bacterium]|nr:methionyl-tRNA formyltransferase [Thermodesulfobacteriota bacterium]